VVLSHQNVDTRTNYTGCGGRILGCSGFNIGGVASGCLDVDDEASLLAGWAVMVTMDVTVYFGFLGADNLPPSLADRAAMVTLDCMGCSIIGGGSPLLGDGARMVTSDGG
jgi:hypothetical protein